MRPIPPKLKKELEQKPEYKLCMRRHALKDHVCQPNPRTGQLIEWEHALIYAGQQINEEYAIVPICWWAHSGPGLKKEINVWLALNRATDDELRAISKAVDYIRERARLNAIYGIPIFYEDKSKNIF